MIAPHPAGEDMLHHFLCAHVGPRAEFGEGELLRCPKCNRNLSPEGRDWEILPAPAALHLPETQPAG